MFNGANTGFMLLAASLVMLMTPGLAFFYGNFHLAFLRHVGIHSIYAPSGIPTVVLIAYQMMFAIITPALITGAFTNRVTFKACLIFLVVWQLFVYYPF